jgi:hypothetical protein
MHYAVFHAAALASKCGSDLRPRDGWHQVAKQYLLYHHLAQVYFGGVLIVPFNFVRSVGWIALRCWSPRSSCSLSLPNMYYSRKRISGADVADRLTRKMRAGILVSTEPCN